MVVNGPKNTVERPKVKKCEKKRKYEKSEIREILDHSTSESEREDSVNLVLCSLNTYFGTRKEKNDIEKPWMHKLKVFPSKEFCTSMLRYDELTQSKPVRQNHKYGLISIFIQSADRIIERIPIDRQLKEELRLQRDLYNRPASLIINRFLTGKSN